MEPRKSEEELGGELTITASRGGRAEEAAKADLTDAVVKVGQDRLVIRAHAAPSLSLTGGAGQ